MFQAAKYNEDLKTGSMIKTAEHKNSVCVDSKNGAHQICHNKFEVPCTIGVKQTAVINA